jgi:Rne/Rng family ribonuclease
MKKSILISEADNIAALLENDRVVEFFVNRGELLLGDIYTATVENILPGIDAAFVNLGKDKMGFLHANDVPGTGALKEKLVPKQKLLVQITKEPTGHKGPRVSTAMSLPGRFLVLVPEERGVSISRRISEAKERSRLKAIVNLIKPPGVGLIIRTEAKGQGEGELFEDFEQLWDRWQTIVSDGEASIGPALIYRDQDLLFRVIRDAYSNDISEIIVDSADGQKRASEYMTGWAGRTTKVLQHVGEEPLLLARNIDREIEAALSDRVELPSGGHLNIQPTEALTVIDVNSGRFTSSRTQAETVRRTNLEAAAEISRQLRLRNIGGMVIVDFIDMDSRRDQQQVLEQFQRALEDDRAKPQVGQLSDLGLVELTRRRQGQSLRELFTSHCATCTGLGVVPSLELGAGEQRRVLSFKPKEEDSRHSRRQKGNQRQQQGGLLRAVSAGGGRVKPTIVETADEEEAELLAEVPEEILQQMPDDILKQERTFSKGNFAPGEDEEEDVEIEEEQAQGGANRTQARGNANKMMAEYPPLGEQLDEDEEEEFEEIEPVAAAVMDNRFDEDEEDEEEDIESEPELAPSAPIYGAVVEDELEEVTVEEVTPLPEPESPFETEIDPVTGVYRLKPKPEKSPDEQQHHHEHEHQHHHEHGEHHHHEHEQHHEHHQQHHEQGGQSSEHHTLPIQTASTIELSSSKRERPIGVTVPNNESQTDSGSDEHGGHEHDQ